MNSKIISKWIRQCILVVSLICLSLVLASCSMIGLGIGSLIDNGRPEYGPVKQGKLNEVNKGRKIIVKLDDSTTVAGKFGGVTEIDDILYRSNYTKLKSEVASQILLPEIGDTVEFSYPSGARLSGALVGFQQKFPCYPCSTYVVVNLTNYGVQSKERLQFLPHLYRPSGDSLETSKICELIGKGKIPIMSQISIINGEDNHQYPLEKINEIKIKNGRNAKWVGFFIGLGIDAAIVALGIFLHDSMSWGGGSY